MNKTSRLFERIVKHKVPRPIQLVKFIDNDNCNVGGNGRVTDLLDDAEPKNFETFNNAKLISMGDVFDVIALWSDATESNQNMEQVAVYLGHWNDGILP